MSVLKEYSLSQEEIDLTKGGGLPYYLKYSKKVDKKHIQSILNLIKENPWLVEKFWITLSPKYKKKMSSIIPKESVEEVKETVRWLKAFQECKMIANIIPYGLKNTLTLIYLSLQVEVGRKFLFQERSVKKLSLKKIETLYLLYTVKKIKSMEEVPSFLNEMKNLPFYSNPYYEQPTFIFEDKIRAKGFLKSIKGVIPFKEENMSEEEEKELRRIFATLGKEYVKYKAFYKEEINGNKAIAKSLLVIPLVTFLAILIGVTGFLLDKTFFYVSLNGVSIGASIFVLYSLLKEKCYKKFPKPLIIIPVLIKTIINKSTDPDKHEEKEFLSDVYTYNKIKERFPELDDLKYFTRSIEKAYKSC